LRLSARSTFLLSSLARPAGWVLGDGSGWGRVIAGVYPGSVYSTGLLARELAGRRWIFFAVVGCGLEWMGLEQGDMGCIKGVIPENKVGQSRGGCTYSVCTVQ
jgi:hypothetical protein